MTQCDSGDMALLLPDGIGIRMMRSSDMPQVRALHVSKHFHKIYLRP
jgi:hypothetical protein